MRLRILKYWKIIKWRLDEAVSECETLSFGFCEAPENGQTNISDDVNEFSSHILAFYQISWSSVMKSFIITISNESLSNDECMRFQEKLFKNLRWTVVRHLLDSVSAPVWKNGKFTLTWKKYSWKHSVGCFTKKNKTGDFTK